MKRKLTIFVLLAAVISLSACIYIPKPGAEPEPYEDANPTTIHTGETTRSEIVDLLGQPFTTRRNDLVWIYFGDRTTGYGVNINPFLILPWTIPLHDLQAAVIVFENDVVEKFEIIEHFDEHPFSFLIEHPSCTSFGICLEVWVSTFSPDSIVTSKGNDDKQAKQFQSLSNKCSLYIYNTDSHHYGIVTATIGSVKIVEFGLTGYINLLLKPGSHKLKIAHGNTRTSIKPAERNISCTSGSIKFIEVYWKGWSWNRRFTINEVDERPGRKAIENRELILMP